MIHLHSQPNQKKSPSYAAALPAGDALTELLESLSRSSLIRSLMEMVAKVDSNGRLNGARTFIERDVEKKAGING
jgi:hypothetical protein